MYKFSCPYHLEGCSKRFRSQSGRTYHVRTVHSNNHNIIHNRNENGPENEILHDDNHGPPVEDHEDDYFMDADLWHDDDVPPSTSASPTGLEPANVHPPTPQRNFHPHINGIFYISSFFP